MEGVVFLWGDMISEHGPKGEENGRARAVLGMVTSSIGTTWEKCKGSASSAESGTLGVEASHLCLNRSTW